MVKVVRSLFRLRTKKNEDVGAGPMSGSAVATGMIFLNVSGDIVRCSSLQDQETDA